MHIMNPRKTLILGAGASLHLGYPSGYELRREIIRTLQDKPILQTERNIDANLASRFCNEFNRSATDSIDAFLSVRSEFAEIGKLTIAAILLAREDENHLFENMDPPAADKNGKSRLDNWYRYLVNQILPEKWDDIDLSWLSIITFNYDRSLEHYLLYSIMARYGKTQSEVCGVLSMLSIMHVYGSVGPTLPSEPGYSCYGARLTPELIDSAADRIKVIPEAREDDAALVLARNTLEMSDDIAFMGFGFDRTNLSRLDSKNTCKGIMLRDRGVVKRYITGTCWGMTESEIRIALRETSNPQGGEDQNSLFDMDCLTFLRYTGFLRA